MFVVWCGGTRLCSARLLVGWQAGFFHLVWLCVARRATTAAVTARRRHHHHHHHEVDPSSSHHLDSYEIQNGGRHATKLFPISESLFFLSHALTHFCDFQLDFSVDSNEFFLNVQALLTLMETQDIILDDSGSLSAAEVAKIGTHSVSGAMQRRHPPPLCNDLRSRSSVIIIPNLII